MRLTLSELALLSIALAMDTIAAVLVLAYAGGRL
jgi:hypothetical protein